MSIGKESLKILVTTACYLYRDVYVDVLGNCQSRQDNEKQRDEVEYGKYYITRGTIMSKNGYRQQLLNRTLLIVEWFIIIINK